MSEPGPILGGMPDLDDIRRIVRGLPDVEERERPSGTTWFVRGRMFAWVARPWPSIPDDMREIIGTELVVSFKVAEHLDAQATKHTFPDVVLRETSKWVEPKIAVRMERIEHDHLVEIVTEAWRSQAPRAVRRAWEDAAGNGPDDSQ